MTPPKQFAPLSRLTARRGRAPIAGIFTALALFAACSGGSRASGQEDTLGLSGNETPLPDGMARVYGRVFVGPLCPVMREPPDPSCLARPETYVGIEVVVQMPELQEVASTQVDGRGTYSVDVAPGTYVVGTRGGPGLGGGGSGAGGVGGTVGSGSGQTAEPPATGDAGSAGQGGAGAQGPTGGGDEKQGDGSIGSPSKGPVTVTLEAGDLKRVDFRIDTGIR
jgi:hypothetical protein